MDLRVGFSSWIIELRFRVRIFELGFSSWDVESVFFKMVTSNPAATNRLVCIRRKVGGGGGGHYDI